MKFTVIFIASVCIWTSAATEKKKSEEQKDKREAATSYHGSQGHQGHQGQSSHAYQSSLGQGSDGNTVSIGAGYSIGGAKPTYSYEGHGASAAALQQIQPESLSPNGHATIQLAPITLQPSHGGQFSSSDLSQLMSQITHSINSGAGLQSNGLSEAYLAGGQGGQELIIPQFAYGAPKVQQYVSEQSHSMPSYASGTKGLSSYSSTGPVLFKPAEVQASQQGGEYAPSSGHSFDAASFTHSFPGLSVGGGHSFPTFKSLSANQGYTFPSKTSFKPSTFLGSSVQEDGQGLSGFSGSYGGQALEGSHNAITVAHEGLSLAPAGLGGMTFSTGGHEGLAQLLSSGGHGGLSLGSAGQLSSFGGAQGGYGGAQGGFGSGSVKFVAAPHLPAKAVSLSHGYSSSPPGTTYGSPSSSYHGHLTASHAASSNSPHYIKSSKYGSFGPGSSKYRSPGHGSSHSSFSSYPSGPKYSFSSSHRSPSTAQYAGAKDLHGAYSENSYNTIKYSEELKPRI